MFKMNPHAKEFIPAHILRKRKEQEEADKLAQVTNDFEKVKIHNENGTERTVDPKNINSSGKTTNNTTETPKESGSVKSTTNEPSTAKASSNRKLSTNNDDQHTGNHPNQNLPDDYYYPDEDEFGDEVYLAGGENICEFNGEQFIIPNDDHEYDQPRNVAYDFGNDEDNEDEDVRKAFEQFLGDLPQ